MHRQTSSIGENPVGHERWGGAACGIVKTLIANRAYLVNTAAGITGCRCRAEDVVQDVFVKVVKHVPEEEVRQPLAYLTRMVRNLAIDHYRRQAFESCHYEEGDEGLDVASPYAGPESAAIHRDLLRRIADGLAQLPARTQAAFEMVRLTNLTLQEAARQLGVSQTLVHFMVRDATEHCRACVGANG